MSGTAPAEERRGPGRPRSPRVHAAILQATLELLAEHGLARLSIEQVAARAGASKATIYRRWESKSELVAEAIAQLNADFPVVDTGTARGDFLELSRTVIDQTYGGRRATLAALLTEAADDPELLAIFRARLAEPRRAAMAAIVRRGQERGELRADLDVDLAVDLIAGPTMYRTLIHPHEPEELKARVARYWDELMRGIAPSAR